MKSVRECERMRAPDLDTIVMRPPSPPSTMLGGPGEQRESDATMLSTVDDAIKDLISAHDFRGDSTSTENDSASEDALREQDGEAAAACSELLHWLRWGTFSKNLASPLHYFRNTRDSPINFAYV